MKFKFSLLILLMALTGCATTNTSVQPQVDVVSDEEVKDVYDPLEPLNRRVYKFNYYFDHYVLYPVAKTYLTVTPKPVRKGIGNFLSNLTEIPTFINSTLQLKPRTAGITASRFAVNTTLGIFGIFDVATPIGLKKHQEDFGQTLAYYGVGDGPYLIVPFLGPSNARDLTGFGADIYAFNQIDPLNFRVDEKREYFYLGLEAIDTRVKVPVAYFESGSPFEYELLRRYYTDSRKIKAGSFEDKFKKSKKDTDEKAENQQDIAQ